MSTPSTSQEVIVPLPEQAKAPGYRDSFTNLAGMRVRELAPDWLAIAPREGAGSVYDYFTSSGCAMRPIRRATRRGRRS
jgi:hypothetical protein